MSASCCPLYISRPIIDFYYLSKEKFLQLIAIYAASRSLLPRIHAAAETAKDGFSQLCSAQRRTGCWRKHYTALQREIKTNAQTLLQHQEYNGIARL